MVAMIKRILKTLTRLPKTRGGHIKLIAVGNSILANNRYAGGPGRSAPELLFENNNQDFPGQMKQDIKSLDPEAELFLLAKDGGTFESVIEEQMVNLPIRNTKDVVIVLIAVGGNDLISRIQDQNKFSETIYAHFVTQIRLLVDYLEESLQPDILLIANTYDPTGGAGDESSEAYAGILPVSSARRALLRINNDLKSFCESRHARYIDLYRRFLGHGFNQNEPWITQHIEPNYLGSHIIRRMFWDVMVKDLVKYGFSPLIRKIN